MLATRLRQCGGHVGHEEAGGVSDARRNKSPMIAAPRIAGALAAAAILIIAISVG